MERAEASAAASTGGRSFGREEGAGGGDGADGGDGVGRAEDGAGGDGDGGGAEDGEWRWGRRRHRAARRRTGRRGGTGGARITGERRCRRWRRDGKFGQPGGVVSIARQDLENFGNRAPPFIWRINLLWRAT